MLNAVVFTDQEIELIDKKISSTTFNASSWEDDDLKLLRKKIKSFYLSNQNNTCVYCHVKMPSNHGRIWDIEHVICRHRRSEFMFEPRNLCVSCIDCNNSKGIKPVTSSTARKKYPSNFNIIHPHFDKYDEHIKIIQTGKYYVANTLKGEKTISVCRLNRFYEIADYAADGTDLDEIQSLAAQLNVATTEKQKQEIFKKLAVAAIANIKA